MGEVGQRYQLPVIKISLGDIMYSTVTKSNVFEAYIQNCSKMSM